MSEKKDVIIIGGGIAGLSCAWQLEQAGQKVTLVEKEARCGGAVSTRKYKGYLIETGPNSIMATAARMPEVIHSLGLDNKQIKASPEAKNRFIVKDGTLVPLPLSPVDFFRSPLFSVAAKLRLLKEPFIRRASQDESVASFVTRRLGKEFLDYAINPFVSGVYADAPEELSLQCAFPRLHALEKKYGSLIKGQIFGARDRKKSGTVAKNKAGLFSFTDGLCTLSDAMADSLADLRLKCKPTGITKRKTGWQVELSDGTRLQSARLVVAVPAWALQSLPFSAAIKKQFSWAADIEYPPVATVALGYKREQIAHPLNGFGMLIPRLEQRAILGALFSSSLFSNRAPAGHELITVFIGGKSRPELAGKTQAELISIAHADVASLLKITGEPSMQYVKKWQRAIPQFDLAYSQIFSRIHQLHQSNPTLRLIGNYTRGISVADTFSAALQQAQQIAEA